MKTIKEMSLGELAAYVCTHLKNNGIHCVLSGGACVSIYTENQYKSLDLDFIENLTTKRIKITRVLSEIGFIEENRYFKHPDTEYFIEFPKGPLAIGSEPVNQPHVMAFETGQLYLLSPTDCVKDRLAAYYYWQDLPCLEQAILIVKDNQNDIDEIKRWSKNENMLQEFNEIKEKLNNKSDQA